VITLAVIESEDDTADALRQGKSQSDSNYLLLSHQCCTCHTLNLITATDAETAKSNPGYKKIYQLTFGKCQGLWNKHEHSTLAVEAVINVYGLVKATRWSSSVPCSGANGPAHERPRRW